MLGDLDLLEDRLRVVGLAPSSITAAGGGVIALGGLVTLDDGREVFAKTLRGADSDIFRVEAAGLRALKVLGDVMTPAVVLATGNLLVLEALCPRGHDARFWEQAGRMLATLHSTTVNDRFGWEHDGWLGRMRQDNTWTDNGWEFFAQRRILRWLPEPLVQAAFDRVDRENLERLCAALGDLIPPQPSVLTHGDLWLENVLATADGHPALIDPAASFSWAEADLSMMWCSPRPPVTDRFFDAYAELAPLVDGWQRRMSILHLRELLSIVAHGDDDWGAVDAVRDLIRPFARRSGGGTASAEAGSLPRSRHQSRWIG